LICQLSQFSSIEFWSLNRHNSKVYIFTLRKNRFQLALAGDTFWLAGAIPPLFIPLMVGYDEEKNDRGSGAVNPFMN
jgi:hypothetical protein